MTYMIPGALAGVCFYLTLVLANSVLTRVWSEKYRLSAHARLVVFCFVAVAVSIFLAMFGGGGNSATHLQISGFLLVGVLLSLK